MKKVLKTVLLVLKQLLPLTYRSHYGTDDEKHFCVWNMWLGKVYNKEDYVILGDAKYTGAKSVTFNLYGDSGYTIIHGNTQQLAKEINDEIKRQNSLVL